MNKGITEIDKKPSYLIHIDKICLDSNEFTKLIFSCVNNSEKEITKLCYCIEYFDKNENLLTKANYEIDNLKLKNKEAIDQMLMIDSMTEYGTIIITSIEYFDNSKWNGEMPFDFASFERMKEEARLYLEEGRKPIAKKMVTTSVSNPEGQEVVFKKTDHSFSDTNILDRELTSDTLTEEKEKNKKLQMFNFIYAFVMIFFTLVFLLMTDGCFCEGHHSDIIDIGYFKIIIVFFVFLPFGCIVAGYIFKPKNKWFLFGYYFALFILFALPIQEAYSLSLGEYSSLLNLPMIVTFVGLSLDYFGIKKNGRSIAICIVLMLIEILMIPLLFVMIEDGGIELFSFLMYFLSVGICSAIGLMIERRDVSRLVKSLASLVLFVAFTVYFIATHLFDMDEIEMSNGQTYFIGMVNEFQAIAMCLYFIFAYSVPNLIEYIILKDKPLLTLKLPNKFYKITIPVAVGVTVAILFVPLYNTCLSYSNQYSSISNEVSTSAQDDENKYCFDVIEDDEHDLHSFSINGVGYQICGKYYFEDNVRYFYYTFVEYYSGNHQTELYLNTNYSNSVIKKIYKTCDLSPFSTIYFDAEIEEFDATLSTEHTTVFWTNSINKMSKIKFDFTVNGSRDDLIKIRTDYTDVYLSYNLIYDYRTDCYYFKNIFYLGDNDRNVCDAVKYFDYEKSSNGLAILGFPDVPIVYFPSEIEDVKVTNVFVQLSNYSNVKEIYIPEGIECIDYMNFDNCDSLSSITIIGVETICDHAISIEGNENLIINYYLPSESTINSYAFQNINTVNLYKPLGEMSCVIYSCAFYNSGFNLNFSKSCNYSIYDDDYTYSKVSQLEAEEFLLSSVYESNRKLLIEI